MYPRFAFNASRYVVLATDLKLWRLSVFVSVARSQFCDARRLRRGAISYVDAYLGVLHQPTRFSTQPRTSSHFLRAHAFSAQPCFLTKHVCTRRYMQGPKKKKERRKTKMGEGGGTAAWINLCPSGRINAASGKRPARFGKLVVAHGLSGRIKLLYWSGRGKYTFRWPLSRTPDDHRPLSRNNPAKDSSLATRMYFFFSQTGNWFITM